MSKPIPDPYDLATDPVFQVKMIERYEDVDPDDFTQQYSAVCDALTQLLYADRYGTSPDDPQRHTSDACRTIATLLLRAGKFLPESEASGK